MNETDLSQLELDNEVAEKQVSLAEKRALIKQAKMKYGSDWMKFFTRFGGRAGTGMNWNELKFRI